MLELFLAFSMPRRDVKPLAKKLIEKFGGMLGVLDTDQQQLEQLNGLGFMSTSLIRLVKELYTSYLSETMKERDVLS
jgi:DNA repair protein RadC